MKLLQGSLDYQGNKLSYDVVLCDQCCYIYLGGIDRQFASLVYAIKTRFEEEPTVATLISAGENDAGPEKLGEQLSTSAKQNCVGVKLKMPVALSVNLPISDPMEEAKLGQLLMMRLVPEIMMAARP